MNQEKNKTKKSTFFKSQKLKSPSKPFSRLEEEMSLYLEGLKKRLGRMEKNEKCPLCQAKMVVLEGKKFCGEFCFEKEATKKPKEEKKMALTIFDEKMQALFLSKGRRLPSIEMVKAWWSVVFEQEEKSLSQAFKTYMVSLKSDLQVSILLDFSRKDR